MLLTVVRFEFALTLIHDCKQRFCTHRFPIALNTSDVSQLLKALLLLMCVANLNRVQLFQDQQGFCFPTLPPGGKFCERCCTRPRMGALSAGHYVQKLCGTPSALHAHYVHSFLRKLPRLSAVP